MAWTNFVAGTTAVAAEVNANFDYVQTNYLPMTTAGVLTDATYELGSSSYNWKSLYLDNGATHAGQIFFNAGASSLYAENTGTKLTYLQISSAGTALSLAVNDGQGRETVLRSPGSTPNGQVGTSSAHDFEIITGNTIRGYVNTSGRWTFGTSLTIDNGGATVAIANQDVSQTLGTRCNLMLDNQGGSLNDLTQIGLGYVSTGNDYAPAVIGWKPTNTSGSTKGDIIFATRDVTSDSAPTERVRITSDGKLKIGSSASFYYDGSDLVLEKNSVEVARW